MPGVYKVPMVRMFSVERELTKLRMYGSIGIAYGKIRMQYAAGAVE